ncbi:MAG TPA: hypothetical protein DIC34_01515 [Treponema sp.]|nr:hypothetical protein [Treponema sp.]
MMPVEFFEGFLSSALVAKLFLEAAVGFVVFSFSRDDTDGAAPWMLGALAFLAFRDCVQEFASFPGLPVASDTCFTALMVVAALRRTNGFRAISFAVAALFLSVAALIAAAAFPYIAFLPLAAALVALLLLALERGKGEGAADISRTGAWAVALALLVPPLSLLLLPHEARERFALPLAYLAFLAASVEYGKKLEARIIKDRDYLADTIDALYGFVLNASDSLRAGADLSRLMNYVAETFATETRADGSLVLMVEDFEDAVAAYATHGNFPPLSAIPEEIPRTAEGMAVWLKTLKVKTGEGFIGETAQSGKAAFVVDASTDRRIVVDPWNPAGSVIAVPFLIDDRVIGLAIVARKKGADPFEDSDFDRASLLADFASLVINNVFSFQEVTEKSDIDTAASISAQIQKALRPKRIADFTAASFGCFSESARGVCGDYYDVISVRKDRIYLVLADVAGKGVSASLIMVMIRAILHLITATDKDASTILSWVNRGITGKIDIDHFATLQIVVIDPRTGSCEYANAGHKPPLVWRQETGLVDAIELKSVPIGVEKNTEFPSLRFTLEDGDILLMYTDGVVETINQTGRQYGLKNLTTMLHKVHDLDAKGIANKIQMDVDAFGGSGRRHDDQTVLVMKTRR